MRLANQHKAYLGVLGVALAALAVDSFVLRDDSVGPAQAHAAPTPTTPSPAAPAAAAAPAQPSATAAAIPARAKPAEAAAPAKPRLAARLQTLKEASAGVEVTQLFASGPEWLNPPPPEPEAPGTLVTGTDGAPAPAHIQPHELTSVLVAGDRSCVILDGKTLRIGDTLGDLKLSSVEHGAALFEWNGQIVRMVVTVK